MTNEGINKFLEYLDNLSEMITVFKGLAAACEVTGDLPLSDDQIEAMNVYFDKMQEDWTDTFIMLLELGVKWLKNNKEVFQ